MAVAAMMLASLALAQNPPKQDKGSFLYNKKDPSVRIPLPPGSAVWSFDAYGWKGMQANEIGLKINREGGGIYAISLDVRLREVQKPCAAVYAEFDREPARKALEVQQFPVRWERPGILLEIQNPKDRQFYRSLVLCRPAGGSSLEAFISPGYVVLLGLYVHVLEALGDTFASRLPTVAAPSLVTRSGNLDVRITNNGKPVENAQITLIHVATNKSYTLKTDKDGRCSSAAIPFGNFEIEIIGAKGETLSKEKREITGEGAHPVSLNIDLTNDLVNQLLAPEMDHIARAFALREEGELDEAIGEFREALREKPSDADLHYYLGDTLRAKGDLNGAIREFGEALRFRPDVPAYYYCRGDSYRELRQLDKALADFNKMLALDPGNLNGIAARADVFYYSGDYRKAAAEYSQLLGTTKLPLAYFRRAWSYYSLGNYQAALADYEKTIELDPKSLDAFNSLAWLLATTPVDSMRNGARAVEYAQRAVDLAGSRETYLYMDTLAAAYAEAGRFGEAASLQRKAISLLPKDFDEKEKAGFETRLRLYEQRKPYREPTKP